MTDNCDKSESKIRYIYQTSKQLIITPELHITAKLQWSSALGKEEEDSGDYETWLPEDIWLCQVGFCWSSTWEHRFWQNLVIVDLELSLNSRNVNYY